jgi:hypothetical protein
VYIGQDADTTSAISLTSTSTTSPHIDFYPLSTSTAAAQISSTLTSGSNALNFAVGGANKMTITSSALSMALPINSIMPSGPAYGVSMGMIPTSTNSAGINISAATSSAVCYVSFNSNGRTPTQNGYIAYNNNDNSMFFNTIQGQHMKLDGTNATCSVLIGTSTSSSANKLYVNGQSYAVTVAGGSKPFDIPHQSKPGMRLRHRAIESPEAGVLYRFRMNCEVGENTLTLPDYYTWLATDPYVFVSPYR